MSTEKEIKEVAAWLYDQNAQELSDGTIVALGHPDCEMVARCIIESADAKSDLHRSQLADKHEKDCQAICKNCADYESGVLSPQTDPFYKKKKDGWYHGLKYCPATPIRALSD